MFFVYRNDRDGDKYFVGVVEDEKQAKRLCRELVDTGAESAYLKQLGCSGAVYHVKSKFDYDKWSIPIDRQDSLQEAQDRTMGLEPRQ